MASFAALSPFLLILFIQGSFGQGLLGRRRPRPNRPNTPAPGTTPWWQTETTLPWWATQPPTETTVPWWVSTTAPWWATTTPPPDTGGIAGGLLGAGLGILFGNNNTITGRQCPGQVRYGSVLNHMFYGTLLGSVRVDSEQQCADLCYSHPFCESANLHQDRRVCELNAESRVSNPSNYKFRSGVLFLDNVKCDQGSTKAYCGRPADQPRMNNAAMTFASAMAISYAQLTEARPNSFPWMVSIQKDRTHVCSGVLLSENFILTSASCFAGSINPSSYQAILGGHSVTQVDPGQQQVPLSGILRHEGFNPQFSRRNDIALARLGQTARFGSTIQPICLPDFMESGDQCVTVGWNKIGGYASVDRLGQLVTPIIQRRVCNSLGWYRGEVENGQICAGRREAVSCQPDRGGPLLCTRGGTWVVKGVSSWGEGCSRRQKPAVYTDVRQYVDWIRRNAGITGLGTGNVNPPSTTNFDTGNADNGPQGGSAPFL